MVVSVILKEGVSEDMDLNPFEGTDSTNVYGLKGVRDFTSNEVDDEAVI